MGLLYRGICAVDDEENGGRLIPKGDKSEVIPLLDDKWKLDGTFVLGESEDNAARAHQIESGLYGGCFVSFTRNIEVAKRYALNCQDEPCSEGFVYVVDEALLEKFAVVAKEYSNPEHPRDQEVSLRACDCGEIPLGIVTRKIKVIE